MVRIMIITCWVWTVLDSLGSNLACMLVYPWKSVCCVPDIKSSGGDGSFFFTCEDFWGRLTMHSLPVLLFFFNKWRKLARTSPTL